MLSVLISTAIATLPCASNSQGFSLSSVSMRIEIGGFVFAFACMSFLHPDISCLGKRPMERDSISGPLSIVEASLSRIIISLSSLRSISLAIILLSMVAVFPFVWKEVFRVMFPFSVIVSFAEYSHFLENEVEKPEILTPVAKPTPLENGIRLISPC